VSGKIGCGCLSLQTSTHCNKHTLQQAHIATTALGQSQTGQRRTLLSATV
jgi:hypothetical protein